MASEPHVLDRPRAFSARWRRLTLGDPFAAPRPRPLWGLLLGLGVLVGLTVLKLSFSSTIGEPTPFLLYFCAVVATAWYGGLAAALATSLAAALIGNFAFVPPTMVLSTNPAALAQTTLFLAECVVIAGVTAAAQMARRQSAEAAARCGVAVDELTTVVNERRAQAERLRLSHEWLETVLRSIGDAVITTDRLGAVSYLNPVAALLTGWDPEAARGRPLAEVFDITTPTASDPVPPVVERVLREGTALKLGGHATLRRRNGTEVPVEDSTAPIKAEDGELVGTVLVFRDVSVEQRKETRRAFLIRASAELNSSLDYERTLAAVARAAVPAIADYCTVDIVAGEGLRRLALAHADPAKIALSNELERRYPSDLGARAGVAAVLRTGEPTLLRDIPEHVYESVARDAEHLRLIHELDLCSYIGVPIKHASKLVGVISLAMAESRRHYDEDDLRAAIALGERAASAIENASLFREAERLRADAAAQRDRLQAMIMAAPSAIAVLRVPELTFEMMNEPFRARVGTGVFDGHAISDATVAPASLALLREVYDSGEPRSAVEQPVAARDAGPDARYLSYTLQPLRNVEGRIDRVVYFATDVTDEVLARRRLETARAEAELANRSKDEFLAMLGHELRNPLAPILTALQLMTLRAGNAMQRERDIIERQVTHVVRLVDDLLDVSRITRGKVELAREVVEVSDVVSKAIEMSRPLVEQREHDVTTEIEEGLYVDGDPMRLAQIVANLLNNAAKYTEKRGHIWIHAARTDGWVVLSVRDDGIGIEPQMLPRVFDLFVQEGQALDRAQGGLGIGLAIVRSLVVQHGGTVVARSEGIGRGSEFEIRLPLVARPRPRPAPPPTLAKVEAGERILVVDDNADALDLLSTSLEHLGYTTLRAVDGPSALVVASHQRPTIALLDIGLPVMDGYELARRLREIEGLEGIKLVAITGYGQPSDRKRSSEAGFDDHLVKPVTIKAVQDAIEGVRR